MNKNVEPSSPCLRHCEGGRFRPVVSLKPIAIAATARPATTIAICSLNTTHSVPGDANSTDHEGGQVKLYCSFQVVEYR